MEAGRPSRVAPARQKQRKSMKTFSETRFETDPFNARAMMENNWGQISDERKARWERRRAWREGDLPWRRECSRKERYENERADR